MVNIRSNSSTISIVPLIALSAALVVAPVFVDSHWYMLAANVALAHGNGNGGGGGGGGNGNGGGGGGGGNATGNSGAHGGAAEAGHGKGHGASDADSSAASANAASDADDAGHGAASAAAGMHGKGMTAAPLGALNAAHASPTALAHAAPNSRVGLLAAYRADINAFNAAVAAHNHVAAAQALHSAALALASASNKGISPAVVTAVNSRLGITTSPRATAEIAEQAEALSEERAER